MSIKNRWWTSLAMRMAHADMPLAGCGRALFQCIQFEFTSAFYPFLLYPSSKFMNVHLTLLHLYSSQFPFKSLPLPTKKTKQLIISQQPQSLMTLKWLFNLSSLFFQQSVTTQKRRVYPENRLTWGQLFFFRLKFNYGALLYGRYIVYARFKTKFKLCHRKWRLRSAS